MKTLPILLVLSILLFSACTAFIDNAFEQNFIGCWESISYTDQSTGTEIELPSFTFLTLLEHSGDSFDANADGTFNMYYQNDSEDITASGTYNIDIGDVTFEFDDGTSIERSIISGGVEEMILSDTLNGNPITIRFSETCP